MSMITFILLSSGSGLGALQRDSKFAKEFLCRVADRVLFARDDYGNEPKEFLESLDLPEDVQEKIYFKNALNLAGLPQAKGNQYPA